MSVRDVSTALAQVGARLLPSGVLRLESADETNRRRLDVDDLAALALALDTSPWFLLSPRDREPIAITPTYVQAGDFVSEWLRGNAMMPRDPSVEYEANRDIYLHDAPPWAQHEHRRPHDAVAALAALRSALLEAIGETSSGHNPGERAELLRRGADRVARHVELLAEQLEHEQRIADVQALADEHDGEVVIVPGKIASVPPIGQD